MAAVGFGCVRGAVGGSRRQFSSCKANSGLLHSVLLSVF